VEELRHHVRDLEGQNGNVFWLRRGKRRFLREAMRQRRFDLDEPGFKCHRKFRFWFDGVGGD